VLVLADQPRHGARQADPVERRKVEKVGEKRAELVAGALRLRRDPPPLPEVRALVEPEHRLRVPDVDREQHPAGEPRRERLELVFAR